MAVLSVGARPLAARSIVHLDPDLEQNAKLHAVSNNLDDVFIKVGTVFPKRYVASGEGIAKDLLVGQKVDLDGKQGVVYDLDSEAWQLPIEKFVGATFGLSMGTVAAAVLRLPKGLGLLLTAIGAGVGFFAEGKLSDVLHQQRADEMKQFEKQ